MENPSLGIPQTKYNPSTISFIFPSTKGSSLPSRCNFNGFSRNKSPQFFEDFCWSISPTTSAYFLKKTSTNFVQLKKIWAKTPTSQKSPTSPWHIARISRARRAARLADLNGLETLVANQPHKIWRKNMSFLLVKFIYIKFQFLRLTHLKFWVPQFLSTSNFWFEALL